MKEYLYHKNGKLNLKYIAECITDSAQAEWYALNTKDIKAIQQFAEGCFDIALTEQQAMKVLKMSKK